MASSSAILISADEQDTSTRWDAFIGWARRFYEWPEFDAVERGYRLNAARHLRAVRDAVLRGTADWIDLLAQACRESRKKLAHQNRQSSFLKWCRSDPTAAHDALETLWDTALPVAARVTDFMNNSAADVAVGGMTGHFASFLLMTEDPYKRPIYIDAPYRDAYKLTGYNKQHKPPLGGPNGDSGQIYQYGLDFLDHMIEEAHKRGVALHDRLDAQSLLHCITKNEMTERPIADWPEEDCWALRSYRRTELAPEIQDVEAAIAEHTGKSASRQGYRLSTAARREIEQYAMQVADDYFKGQGWSVSYVFTTRPYDLHCIRDGDELRVEVKGTTSDGAEVLLTPGEVRHARKYAPRTALFVLSGIHLEGSEDVGFQAGGGAMNVCEPWKPDDCDLAPVGYVYRVVRSSANNGQ